MLTSRRVMSTL